MFNNGNGHSRQRLYRVNFRAGQYLVVVDEHNGEVDGPHRQPKSGYRFGVAGRRSIHVFDDLDLAMRFAEEAVERLVDEQGEDI